VPPEEIDLVAPEARLETSRLYLEPILRAHATALHESMQEGQLYRFIPQDPPSLEALTDRYDFLAARRSPDGREAWLNWAVREKLSGEYVGTLEATVEEDPLAFISYMVFAPYQRRGFAAEACGRLLGHLFDDYGVGVVAAEIDTRAGQGPVGAARGDAGEAGHRRWDQVRPTPTVFCACHSKPDRDGGNLSAP